MKAPGNFKDQIEIDEDQGCIAVTRLNFVMVAVAVSPKETFDGVEVEYTVDQKHGSHDDQFSNSHQKLNRLVHLKQQHLL